MSRSPWVLPTTPTSAGVKSRPLPAAGGRAGSVSDGDTVAHASGSSAAPVQPPCEPSAQAQDFQARARAAFDKGVRLIQQAAGNKEAGLESIQELAAVRAGGLRPGAALG